MTRPAPGAARGFLDLAALAAHLEGLGREAWDGGALLGAVLTGSAGRGAWTPGEDVDVRALFAVRASRLLGLGSYADELETVRAVRGVAAPGLAPELDLVAFEVGKVARLLLKGHELTLDWLTAPPARRLVTSPTLEALATIAQRRRARADAGESAPLTPEDFGALDALVARARLDSESSVDGAP